MGKHAQRRASVEPTGESTVTDGLKVGSLVWYHERVNGRSTEHLATVRGVGPATLLLEIRDNGELRTIADVAPWGADSTCGWWST